VQVADQLGNTPKGAFIYLGDLRRLRKEASGLVKKWRPKRSRGRGMKNSLLKFKALEAVALNSRKGHSTEGEKLRGSREAGKEPPLQKRTDQI